MPPVAVIVNPVSGAAAWRRTPAECEALARRVLASAGQEPWIAITEGPGHARDLTRRAVEGGASLVLAWGGDGTVNEVASTLLETGGTLGIVPVGSGNGLARDLRLPRKPGLAIAAAVSGSDRWIDAGGINGRVFFNVAGIGFDARVADVFAHRAATTRGLASYVAVTWTELFAYQPSRCHVVADGVDLGVRHTLLISIANTCQWGNGAQIAPCARPDDGLLDLVIVDARPAASVLAQSWRLFTGAIAGMRGVTLHTVRRVTLTADVDLPLHADGEPLPPGAVDRGPDPSACTEGACAFGPHESGRRYRITGVKRGWEVSFFHRRYGRKGDTKARLVETDVHAADGRCAWPRTSTIASRAALVCPSPYGDSVVAASIVSTLEINVHDGWRESPSHARLR